MREHSYWVYIATNTNRTVLYIGVTNNLARRLAEHRLGLGGGFTRRYQVHFLLWAEEFGDVVAAIAAEKKIKGWTRAKKVALIAQRNPRWLDLSEAC